MVTSYAPRPRAYQPKPRQALKPQVQGPFIGMRDNSEPTTADPRLAYLAQNVYPISPHRGGAMIGRPGFQQFGSQLGNGGVGQLVHQFTKLDGTELSIVIVAGELYKADWGARTWTKVIETSDLTGDSITLSSSARCYAVTFNDQMIVTDGTNTPFAWDGTTGGGLTKLTSCPVLFGPPTLYYGKLFGIKNSDRKTIVWSEENQPNVGYEAGGYNNAWDLLQTDQESLFAVVGTNEALYYFRARSIGAIGGAVDVDFQTSGTREGVSETEGTTSPGSVTYRDRTIFFLNAEGLPQVLSPGLGVLRIWEDFSETLEIMDPQFRGDTIGWIDESTQMLGFAMVEIGQSIPSASMMYDLGAHVPQASSVWRGYTLKAIGTVKDASGRLLTMHLSSDGYAYDHGTPDGAVWDDGFAAGDQVITHIIESGAAYYDSDWEKYFDRLEIAFRNASDITGINVSTTTPRGVGEPVGVSVDGAFSRFDEAVFDTDEFSYVALEAKVTIGIAVRGRWIRWRVEHAVAGEEFGLLLGKPRALVLDDESGIA